ncbi:type I-C CRISPR-associated protein Cas8c/Csd1 [Salinibacter ruber]|jgi:hypothetical protein|uniref:type I-C CRISPR-associated protein Cas8c/Csd1 n=1 Tax=Salinibacter ruber TaxID=146919 RepID=UPI00207348EC|nr:type I-C CRISPR-associated protein Cas8c/Csd1 [Salinibacter ruber]
MIEQLVRYYDTQGDIPPPYHRVRTASHSVHIGGGVEVREASRDFVYPNPSRTVNSLPAIGCDQVKYVTGFTGGDPPEDGWESTKWFEDFRAKLKEARGAASEALSKKLKAILRALPKVREDLIENAGDYKEYVVFFVGGQPLLQPAGEEASGLQAELQQMNTDYLSTELGDVGGEYYTAECLVCGKRGEMAGSNLKNTSTNFETARTRQYAKSHGMHVCTTCAAKSNAALKHLNDSRPDQIIRVGRPTNRAKWYFFSASEGPGNLITEALASQEASEEAKRFWRAYLGGQEPETEGDIQIICENSSPTAADRSSFWHTQVREGNRLIGQIGRWLRHQNTDVYTWDLGVQEHLENLASSPEHGQQNKARLYGTADSINDALARDGMLAAVEGRRLPTSHLRPLMTRVTGTSPEVRTSDLPRVIPTILWALPMEENSIPYKLGQLLSVADYLYYRVDDQDLQMSRRYYTMLSEQPSKVFGPLVSDVKTRLSQLQNRNQGAAIHIDKRIGEILGSIEEVPGRLGTDGQAQFALGYYHDRQRRFEGGDDE